MTPPDRPVPGPRVDWLGVETTGGAATDLVVGLDIGGSKTHVVVTDLGGRLVTEFLASSANLAALGPATCRRRLTAVFDQIDRERVVAVCVGAAGVDSGAAARTLRQIVVAQVPGTVVRIVHDSEIILAAAGLASGIVVIAGTGSVAWGRTADGRTARTGGWGYLLGDQGSGYWLGTAAVRHTLDAADAGLAPDDLSRRLLADCGVATPDDLIGHFYATPDRRYWATRSRLVVAMAEQGDEAATAIADQAAGSLAALVHRVGTRLGIAGPVVLAGGVLVNQPAVRDRVAGLLPADSEIIVLTTDPVHGAVALARSLVEPVTH